MARVTQNLKADFERWFSILFYFAMFVISVVLWIVLLTNIMPFFLTWDFSLPYFQNICASLLGLASSVGIIYWWFFFIEAPKAIDMPN